MTMKLVTSCLTNRNRGSRRWAMLSSVPVTRLSMQTTSQPRASRKSQRWEPMNPAPPVTRTRTIPLSEGGYAPLPNLPPGTGCAGKAGARTWNTPTWQAKTLMRHRSDALPPSDWRSASSAGFARATDSWGRLRRGPPRPPPMKRRRWALIIALAPADRRHDHHLRTGRQARLQGRALALDEDVDVAPDARRRIA